MSSSFELTEIGRIPSFGDNLAIAIRRLDKGTEVVSNGAAFELNNMVLEGHRFAVQPIPRDRAGRVCLQCLHSGYASRPVDSSFSPRVTPWQK